MIMRCNWLETLQLKKCLPILETSQVIMKNFSYGQPQTAYLNIYKYVKITIQMSNISLIKFSLVIFNFSKVILDSSAKLNQHGVLKNISSYVFQIWTFVNGHEISLCCPVTVVWQKLSYNTSIKMKFLPIIISFFTFGIENFCNAQ